MQHNTGLPDVLCDSACSSPARSPQYLPDAGHMLAVTPDSVAKRRAQCRVEGGGTPNPLYELEGRTAHRSSDPPDSPLELLAKATPCYDLEDDEPLEQVHADVPLHEVQRCMHQMQQQLSYFPATRAASSTRLECACRWP